MAENALSTIAPEMGAQTMSSREIADLVESRHDSVRRTVERLAEKGVIQLPPLVGVKNHLGQTVEEYRIGKRDSYVIVAQLSPEFTARLVDRWQELEARPAFDPMAALNDPAWLRSTLTVYTEKVLALQGEVKELAPKAKALDRISTADGSLCVRDTAKTLDMKEGVLRKWLIANKWAYTRSGNTTLIARQEKLARGLMEHKTAIFHAPDGTERVSSQARITPKGLASLAEIFCGEMAQ